MTGPFDELGATAGLDIVDGQGQVVASSDGGIALDAVPGGRLQVFATDEGGSPLVIVVFAPDAKTWPEVKDVDGASLRRPVVRLACRTPRRTNRRGVPSQRAGSYDTDQKASSDRSITDRSVACAMATSALIRGRLVCAKNCAAATLPS